MFVSTLEKVFYSSLYIVYLASQALQLQDRLIVLNLRELVTVSCGNLCCDHSHQLENQVTQVFVF